MSFSAKVKEELVSTMSNARHCRNAELSALVTMWGSFSDNIWKCDTDNQYAREKTNVLIKKLDIDVDTDEGKASLKLKKQDGEYTVDNILIERNCCKQAYIRGAFIAAGSVTDPRKGYHFEVVCNTKRQAEILLGIIKDFKLEAKMVTRKKYYVVYIKDGTMIVDILNVMGAHMSLMDMENIRILKDMRNNLNRRVNCEAANINKTVSAAVKQVQDIEYIEREKGLRYLPDNLRCIAELRLEQTEVSLKELGEMLNPPLGKSGVNHRLRKISEIADKLRRSSND